MARRDPRSEIARLRTAGDKVADKITAFAGSLTFVLLHVAWFGFWILASTGVFGEHIRFDPFPFGLLTLVVSLEAIFLSTFVMISQNRQSDMAEIRSRLDYETDSQSEKEISIVMETLERIAAKQNVRIDDLMQKMKELHGTEGSQTAASRTERQ